MSTRQFIRLLKLIFDDSFHRMPISEFLETDFEDKDVILQEIKDTNPVFLSTYYSYNIMTDNIFQHNRFPLNSKGVRYLPVATALRFRVDNNVAGSVLLCEELRKAANIQHKRKGDTLQRV